MSLETPQNAIELLKADHREAEDLFRQFEEKGAHKRAITERLCLALSVHTRIEEEIFYPACQGAVDEALLRESYVEHDGAKVLIAEIEAGGPDDIFYEAKVKVLSEQIKHHVSEEERWLSGLFSQAKRGGLDMDELGAQLAARKRALIKDYRKDGVPTPDTPTFIDVKV